MSRQTKLPMSGLRSVKRDFSSNSVPSSQDSGSSQRSGIIESEKKLKDIKKSLEHQSLSSQKLLASREPRSSQSSSSSSSKRPAESQMAPSAKRRQFPGSWTSAPQQNTKPTSASKSRQISTRPNSHANSKAAEVELSHEQKYILKLVEQGQSVFYTGSAGTGKSVLLRQIIETLRKKFGIASDAVAITASTGIAACNIGGITIHSFAGIALGLGSAEQLAGKVRSNKKASSRWLRTKALIIDEVSMIDGDLFDKLARVGSIIRKNVEPFGGIQLIVTGDFFQLPPVTKGPSGQVKFAFEAQSWLQAVKKTFNLTQVFRQKDPQFVDMLNEMRFGNLSETSIAKFKSLSRAPEYEDGIAPTALYPRREDVETSNKAQINRIGNVETHVYTAHDSGAIHKTDQGAKMLSNFMAPAQITLKIGAQVMLIKNMDDTLVNGSMGTVVGFHAREMDDPMYSGAPQSGSSGSTAKKYPMVEFTSGRTFLAVPEMWKVELPNGEPQVVRHQVPLILSWAMSIHKSQGQTLERVKVDLAKVFEKGQAYVALSRATSLEGLQVLNFNSAKVTVHPKVVKWSDTLETVPT
ncbi:hypothetical protein NLI96_g410 [Meripilus lineatus]|uniref:ATP-dependent DNA helicase PIF1 n=1 Tax=Meripilus lineatus TaxID=2056292 RepID=A0AAD5VEU9_9APHY|nr:hypothetical protein NLI96_g410 [Physisporinus lineatus]